jgi:PRC-barrel domain
MNKAVLIAAALVLAPAVSVAQGATDRKDREPPSVGRGSEQAVPSDRAEDPSRSAIRDRVAQAIEAIEGACAADLDDLCGKVTPGEGRVAMCMRAHEDQLSSGCQSTLRRIAERLRNNVDRVAEACWGEIKAQCGDAGKIGQCLERKRGSLSSTCQTIVGAVERRLQDRTPVVGMSVYSSDNKNIGQVVEIVRGPDDKVQSIQVDIGRVLGLGTKVVTITAEKLERLPGIKVLLSDAEVRSLPEAKKE